MKESIRELREAINIGITKNLPDVSAIAFSDLAVLLAELDQIDAANVALLAARAFDDRAGPKPMQRVLLAGSGVASRAHKDEEAIKLARELVASVEADPTRMINPMTSRHQL